MKKTKFINFELGKEIIQIKGTKNVVSKITDNFQNPDKKMPIQMQVAHKTSDIQGQRRNFPMSYKSHNSKCAEQRKDTESFKIERPTYVEKQA